MVKQSTGLQILPFVALFKLMNAKTRVEVWLIDNNEFRIEGRVIGFDEYMNVVLEEAVEVHLHEKSVKTLGRTLLKGDNICLMRGLTDLVM